MFKAGDIIADRYRVDRMVDQGGMAVVYRVTHIDLLTVHALKMLQNTGDSGRMAERFLLEGQIQARIGHPNVVTVTDVVRHDGCVGLLMEFVEGRSLHDYLQHKGALPVDEALNLISPVLDCLHAFHTAGVLHRDLKPANILLRRTEAGAVPLVADFGIARVRSAEFDSKHTKEGLVMGSPGYMSPEQFIDPDEIDARSDLFSLATILYEMIAGKPAFKGKEGMLLMSTTYTEEVIPLTTAAPHCPVHINDAVMKALTKDLEDRFADIPSFSDALYQGQSPKFTPHKVSSDAWHTPQPQRAQPAATLDAFSDTYELTGAEAAPVRKASWRPFVGAFLTVALTVFVVGSVAIVFFILPNTTTETQVDVKVVDANTQAPASPVTPPAVVEPIPSEPAADVQVNAPSPATDTKPAPGPKAKPGPTTPDVAPQTADETATPTTKETEKLADVISVTEPVAAPTTTGTPGYADAPTEAGTDAPPTTNRPTWTEGRQALSGTIFRQDFKLTFEAKDGGSFPAKGVFTAGTAARQVSFTGQYQPETSTLRFTEKDGDLVLEGGWSVSGLVGTVRRGKRKPSALRLAP